MVDVYMGGDQRFYGVQWEFDGETIRAGLVRDRCVVALEQPAVNQQAAGGIHMQLVTGAGNAVLGAVMFYFWVAHGYSFNDVTQDARDKLITGSLKNKRRFYRVSELLSCQQYSDGRMVRSRLRDGAGFAPMR